MANPKIDVVGRLVHKPFTLLAGVGLALGLTLLVVLILGAPADTQAAAGTSDGLRMLSADAGGVELELDVSRYTLTPREAEGQKFTELSVDGAQPDSAEKGAPQLPLRTVLLGIPQGADVQIAISELRSQVLPQPVRLLPVPSAQVSRGITDPLNVNYTGIKYIPNAAAYSHDQWAPEAAAQVLKTGNMRSQHYVTLALYPFQYNAARQSLQWNQHMHISVRFAYPGGKAPASLGRSQDEGAYEAVLRGQLLNYDSALNWRAARSSAPAATRAPQTAGGEYRIALTQTGIYRLTYAELIGAGVAANSDPRTFKIRKNGAELPIFVSGQADGTFDPVDYVEFYAQAIDNQYTNVNVYWLSVGGANGLRMQSRAATTSGTPLASFRDYTHVEDNHFYSPSYPPGNADHWYWDDVTVGWSTNLPFFDLSPALYTVTLSNVSSAGQGELRTSVMPNFGVPGADIPHDQHVYLNGTLVISDAWNGNVTHQGQGAFPMAALVSSTNVISYNAILTGGVTADAILFNWFELDYNHLYRAQNDYLGFGADITGAVQMTVTNFTTNTLALYDVTIPTQPVIVTGTVSVVGDGYALTVGDVLTQPARYVAAVAGMAPFSVVHDTSASDLRNPANGADEIMIVDDDFYTATAPLAALRTGQGLRTMRVRISDVYDEFSDGVFDPLAIQRFLSYTYAYWGSPAPQYVLLVGNGNLNYRNFEPNNLPYDAGQHDAQLIPPFMDTVDPFINMAASDNHYVSFGADDMPYMAIGRVPARNVTETTTYVNKLIAYEQTPAQGAWRHTVDFFTDNYYQGDGNFDAAGDFYGTADELATHIPTVYTRARVYYCIDTCPYTDPWYISEPDGNTVDDVRHSITTTLNAGALFANYIGHSSFTQWADEAIFYNAGAASGTAPLPDPMAQLQNGARLPIMLELTCRTGSFDRPGVTTLAESAVLFANGGAIADWASTGLGVNEGHGLMAGHFYDAIFVDHLQRVGLAINASKSYLVTTNQYLDLVDEFTLFGDPATVIPISIVPRGYLPLVRR